MSYVPFNVSARAAILIGRENVTNAKGAIIELVKNCYDADSGFCILYVDNYYSEVKKTLAIEEFELYKRKKIDDNILNAVYEFNSSIYTIRDDVKDEDYSLFKKHISKVTDIYIIDAGDGMNDDIIRNSWMTIGTDNKLLNHLTRSSRIKSGAKGIGRFALDKLGASCQMVSYSNPESYKGIRSDSVYWEVNWSDFEGVSKSINEVNARLELKQCNSLFESFKFLDSRLSLKSIVDKVIERAATDTDILKGKSIEDSFQYGTIFKINSPHEVWDETFVRQIYSDLEVLVPPKENDSFSIHLLSSLNKNYYGEVLNSTCDDFDYKLTAQCIDGVNVEIVIDRNEFDLTVIPKDFYERESVKNSDVFNHKRLHDKRYVTQQTIEEMLVGYKDPDLLKEIGPFEFTMYFMKKTIANKDRDRKYFYKKFDSSARKLWLDKFGGIKIYRDNFRVRPYGEIDEPAFDWLGLGQRKASSPAGASSSGAYKVGPDNIAGAIKISRLTNLEFKDKSSREGFQETRTFNIFKNILRSIISKFENDRSMIFSELEAYDNNKYSAERNLKKAEQLARMILNRARDNAEKNDKEHKSSGDNAATFSSDDSIDNLSSSDAALALAQLTESQKETIEKLTNEQILLRGLASSGIVSAALGHDLSKIQGALFERVDELKKMLSFKVSEIDFANVPRYNNPFVMLTQMKQQDENIATWLGFSLGFTRKDKRQRKLLALNDYFYRLKDNWKNTLDERGITLEISCDDGISIKAFEIDFDSIFINLLTNSIDAFVNSTKNDVRAIHIECSVETGEVVLNYKDNGPGLSKSIKNPEEIFDSMFTTKLDYNGNQTGTGLGMWIVKSVIDEYNGVCIISDHLGGFHFKMKFPTGKS